jgi:hypothetical protein
MSVCVFAPGEVSPIFFIFFGKLSPNSREQIFVRGKKNSNFDTIMEACLLYLLYFGRKF